MGRIDHDVVLGGRYRLLERIATGGMGSVWSADDTVLHRRVAVKLLSESLGTDPQFVERFRREARAAAGLSHPNISGVFDYGEEGDTPFLVMELIDGETLADRIGREGRLPPEEAARIAADVADALQAAHEAGVIHRDVKPGNVMLDGRGHVRVMDFGIAAASWAAPITATGTTLGTASYLSPEQASGERATPSSDIYSLGCVLFEMLTGRPPFAGDSPVAVATAHVREAPASVRELAPDTPAALAAACDRALSKDPRGRPLSAAAFASELRSEPPAPAPAEVGVPAGTTQVIGTPAPTAVLPTTEPTAKGPDRRWLWILLPALAALVGLGILVAALMGGSGNEPSNPPSKAPTTTVPPAQGDTVTVPDVVGLPVDDAVARLRSAGIRTSNIDVALANDGDPGIVVDVQPGEGQTVSKEKTVTLFVGPPRGGGGKKDGHGKDNKD
jgi:tRNA A-37 threonylcarbamoyl transferase component Bud32